MRYPCNLYDGNCVQTQYFFSSLGKINEKKTKKLLPLCQTKKQDIPKMILYDQKNNNVFVMKTIEMSRILRQEKTHYTK